MLRLTNMLFRWTGEVRYAEFYERALFNSVLCTQHPHRMGGHLYDHPLSGCSQKAYGGAEYAFWCCYGSTIEAFARLDEGIYYVEDDSLWITQTLGSEFAWEEKGSLFARKRTSRTTSSQAFV
jgi:DUF1680 family protein